MKKNELDEQTVQSILEASNYREALKAILNGLKRQDSKFSMSLFCRRAGFASRSFPGDVIRGTKKLSAKSLPRVLHALKMPQELNHYFSLLVEIEHPELHLEKRSVLKLKQELEKVRNRVNKTVKKHKEHKLDQKIFSHVHRGLVFSSLGDLSKGVTYEEVCQKTQLSSSICRFELETLVRLGAAEKKGTPSRYYPVDTHLVFQDLRNGGEFQTYFLQSLELAHRNARQHFEKPGNLFLNSVVSVKKEKLVEFKKELQGLITRYVDSIESHDGEVLAQLGLAFWT